MNMEKTLIEGCGHEDYLNDYQFKTIMKGNTKCLCGTNIIWNYVIKSKSTKKEFVVGSTCIEKFLPGLRRKCELARYKMDGGRVCAICGGRNTQKGVAIGHLPGS